MAKDATVEIKKTQEGVEKKLQDKHAYKNVMQVPKIEKIIVNRGLGEAVSNSKCIEITLEQFAAITGQKPVTTIAKKSVSNFKLREGQVIGAMVTLRGDKAAAFLVKLINIVLPKIRDFRGVSAKAFDGRGNYSLGLKETAIFPEVKEEDRARGMHITIVTSAQTDKEAYDLLDFYGMPFRKQTTQQ